ncbi:hypothetical protein NP493_1487g00022 [Ridgeia piscesae]|uniref:Solute carrier family 15 member 4 n=1 Tax=Ridgeia piscesae TaxID=27915 RepID=A0AAD9NC12_RIDPI|nr:hypothetical protein NP493_1487g00022 [Ridgeia piscesae]
MASETQPLIGTQSTSSPLTRSRFRTQLACGAVLVTEIFERIAMYGAIGNLVMFLNKTPYNWTSYNSVNALFMFTAVTYMTAIIGGWIADSYLGKCRTILLFFLIYIGGYVFLPLLYPYPDPKFEPSQPPGWCAGSGNSSGWDTDHMDAWDEKCSWAVYLSLGIIALGSAGVKANFAPFGADQVRQEGTIAMRVFFNWFYWCVNVGALVALGLLAYVQQEISFFWGFLAPNVCLVIAVLVFTLGLPVYIKKPAGGSIISNIVRIVYDACRVRHQHWRRTVVTSDLDNANDLETLLNPINDAPSTCLDHAKVRFGGSFHDNMVDDVKALGKILCVFAAMIPYWTVYFQMETTFLIQGLHMRLDFNGTQGHRNITDEHPVITEFKMAVAWLSLFDVFFLIFLIPLFDRLIYPRLDRVGLTPSLRTRIAVGMVFSIASVCTAGSIERYRLDTYWRNGTENIYWQKIGGTFYRAADVSILYQIPQYALIGISEVFASIAGLELAYVHAPRSMQGLIMGLFWLCQGVGSLVGTATMVSFRGLWFFDWDHGDINCRVTCECHLDYYFFFLGGLQLVGLVLFVIIVKVLDIGRASPYSSQRASLPPGRSTGRRRVEVSQQ